MMSILTDYLDKMAFKCPEKIAFVDKNSSISFKELSDCSKRVATSFFDVQNKSVAIFMDKGTQCVCSMMGSVYSGNYYTILDTNMPIERINAILNSLDSEWIITNKKHEEKVKMFSFNKKVIIYEDALNNKIDFDKLNIIRKNIIDTDPMYILFTSGSTGVPKGTVLSHKAVISYLTWFKDEFGIDEDTIFGNQTPLYFSMSVSDVLSTIFSGATLHFIPKMYFSFPVKLIDYINENNINTIYWVPSALSIVANFKVLESKKITTLKRILFAGEVMPTKVLNYYRKHLPDVIYSNLYGPTETTDICAFYTVNREFKNDEALPIGFACSNCDVMIINDKNERVTEPNLEGELYVRGSFLANGYFKNLEKTKEVFVQNPLNNNYPEIVYKTGDLVKYNEFGELVYITRKDFQIKHMGYRIELGEIETVLSAIDEVNSLACIYDNEKSQILLYYQGNISEKEISKYALEHLLPYMRPNKVIKLSSMPLNANGKIDRKKLKEIKE